MINNSDPIDTIPRGGDKKSKAYKDMIDDQ
jgi:hypothetical protein